MSSWRASPSGRTLTAIRVRYRDGKGVLRRVLSVATGHG